MTSELKVDKITPASGTNTQIGEAGDTTNLSAGTVTLPTSIITGATEKTTLVDADKFLISDSADSNAFKHVQKSNLPSGGLVFVGSTSSSSEVTDLTLDNVFTSTYTNYLIVGEYTLINGSGPKAYFRFRSGGSSGSDLSGSEYNYNFLRINADSSTVNYLRDTGGTFCEFSAPTSNDSARVGIRLSWTVYDPFDSSTRTTVSGTGKMTATDGNSAAIFGSCDYKGTGTAVTGIRFYAHTDNVKNGEFRVYGIVDS